VADILKCLFQNVGDLRKLVIECCWLGADSTGVLTKIVVLYPDLEVLSLQGSHPLTPAGYRLIARLKKLSELKLSYGKVDYLYVKHLEIHICIRESVYEKTLEIYFIYLGKKEIYCSFKTCCIISVLLSTKWHFFHDFIIFCSSNTYFVKHEPKFKYLP
jgi:hypothetical protein